ncbi:MAG: MarR family transcriptional regulator [Verrucomicrobia bacterium]|nr:MarR family transcriptional regulator [Verrucomicrobiota bacterium]MBI3871288.1 MarR family transcriptional regulator [Verrucomicrobiota bacterium]
MNGRLFIKTTSFLLDREPKRKVYRNPGVTLNPFTLKSSRVVRVLLSHQTQEWTQAELESRTGISRASVSLTLGDLIERELVEQTRPGNRQVAALYRVRDFNRLLDDWGAEDEWGKRTTIRQYSVLAANLVFCLINDWSYYFDPVFWLRATYRHTDLLGAA